MVKRTIPSTRSKGTIFGGFLIGRKNPKTNIDVSKIVKTVKNSKKIRANLNQTRRKVKQLERFAKKFEEELKDLESQDKLGNFEIQSLMSSYNHPCKTS